MVGYRILTLRDIYDLPVEILPMTVLADNARSLYGLLIRRHTGGFYNHAMMMHIPGSCVSQGACLDEIGIERYFGRHRLKFWHNPHWTDAQRMAARAMLRYELTKPRIKRVYDVLGIFGQWINQPWIQLPWNYYCSEHVAKILGAVDEHFFMTTPSPSDLNRYFKASDEWEVYGISDPGL